MSEIQPTTNVPKAHSYRFDISLAIISLLALAALIPVLISVVPEAFKFRFNPYALISLGALVTNLSLLIILLRRKSYPESTLWFALFLLTGILWSGFEALERMSATPTGAAFWGDIIAGIVAFMPVLFYMFVHSYTDRSRSRIRLWIVVQFIGSALMMMSLLSANNVFLIPDASNIQPWGYLPPVGIVLITYVIWAAILIGAAIIKLIRFYRHSISVPDRRMSLILIICSAAVLLAAATTEVILPILGNRMVPPLGVITNALLALSIIIGNYRYGNLSVDVNDIAETVLGAMGDSVIVTDSNYRVLYCNAKAKVLMRRFGQHLAGLDIRAVYGLQFETIRNKWESELTLQVESNIENVQIVLEEAPVTVDMRISLLKADKPGYIFLLSDITELTKADNDIKTQSAKLELSNKALQESQSAMLNLLEDARALELELKSEKAGIERKIVERTAQLQTERESLISIINSVDFGIYIIGPDLHVNMVNQPMQELYARGMERPYSLAAFDADAQINAETQIDVKEAVRTRSAVIRSEYRRGNRILRSYRRPLYEAGAKHPKLLGIINVLQDITEVKAAERSRDEFFSIASHELRTPLTAIRGNTSMIQDYYADQIKDPTLKEMIGDIHDSSIRLITIVNDFLNTSRLEQGKIEFTLLPFSLLDLVKKVLKEFEAGDVSAKVPISVNVSGAIPNVIADQDRLKEVLINLVGNALKFTDTGSVTLDIALSRDKVKLRVTDTGRGIPQESQGLLFHKFQQASNNILTRDSTRSTGLGLYISKLIMTGMGGEIALEKSATGKGATFAIFIPAQMTQIPTKRSKASVTKRRVKL